MPESLGPKGERVKACMEDSQGGTMFYHTMCEAFLAHLLGYKKLKGHAISKDVGVLGRIRDYYGMTECEFSVAMYLTMYRAFLILALVRHSFRSFPTSLPVHLAALSRR